MRDASLDAGKPSHPADCLGRILIPCPTFSELPADFACPSIPFTCLKMHRNPPTAALGAKSFSNWFAQEAAAHPRQDSQGNHELNSIDLPRVLQPVMHPRALAPLPLKSRQPCLPHFSCPSSPFKGTRVILPLFSAIRSLQIAASTLPSS